MNTEPHTPRSDASLDPERQQKLASFRKEEGVYCPICLLPTGRHIRGKIYCGNCGFIES